MKKNYDKRPISNPTQAASRVCGWVQRLVRYFRRKPCRKQLEINRLRKVLHAIVDSRPDQHMDIEETPELTEWICETCSKAHVGAYPSNNAVIFTPEKLTST